jgi:hypothetical protein
MHTAANQSMSGRFEPKLCELFVRECDIKRVGPALKCEHPFEWIRQENNEVSVVTGFSVILDLAELQKITTAYRIIACKEA